MDSRTDKTLNHSFWQCPSVEIWHLFLNKIFQPKNRYFRIKLWLINRKFQWILEHSVPVTWDRIILSKSHFNFLKQKYNLVFFNVSLKWRRRAVDKSFADYIFIVHKNRVVCIVLLVTTLKSYKSLVSIYHEKLLTVVCNECYLSQNTNILSNNGILMSLK